MARTRCLATCAARRSISLDNEETLSAHPETYPEGFFLKHGNMLASSMLASTIFLTGIAHAQDYDLVIANGRVMDPATLFDDVANVGIRDGRIVAISKDKIEGVETIDATGHIVAPGFIDTHFHWQTPIGYRVGLRDGLTSGMDFEAGCAGSYIAAWYESPRPTMAARSATNWPARWCSTGE